ncbi:LOB domain-containing protein 22 [Morella rubra]|uniref:LOB domain-containing protein 22 n=1 Tax=Morella rubra TaxID=262757 RepID=A0A6A1W0J9_9ROSI|nr:LOB domain-containing protein 22 [Morella rubra]
MNLNARHGNGTTQACAACKYQRRKCAPDCILAPFFPHDRQRQFLNAHKLFGVRNITKIIENLNQQDKERAMHTIIYQSDARANDPVGGCYRIIRDLQRLIDYYQAELEIVVHQLDICRAQLNQSHIQMPETIDPTINSENIISADPSTSYTMQYPYLGPQQDQLFVVNNDFQDVNAWGVQDPVSSSSLHVKHDECEDIKPIFERSCERNEIKLDGDEKLERSYEAMLRIDNAMLKEEDGSMQQAQDHDLKGAATLFTLTNINR